MLIKLFKSQKNEDNEIVSPCEGKLKKLEESSDEVFASKTLGEGFFVRTNKSQIYAPVSGIITSVFPTKHALGIHTENGMDVLIHIGIDTITLQKDTIECTLKKNDRVKKMQPICEFNQDEFKRKGILPDVYIFITNSLEFQIENVSKNQEVCDGDVILKCTRRS